MRQLLHGALKLGGRLVTRWDLRSRSISNVRSLLVCATGGIGNTVLLIPLLRVLKRGLGSARLDVLLTSRPAADLVREIGLADQVRWVPEETWFRGLAPLRFGAFSLRPRRYDMVWRTYLTAPEMRRASLGVFLSGARIRVAYGNEAVNSLETHVLPHQEEQPETERHLALARSLGIETSGEWDGITAPERGKAWAREFLEGQGWQDCKRLVGIHPGCDPGWGAKRWPAQCFGELARRCVRERGSRVIVFGGPDDGQAVNEVVQAAGAGVLPARGQDLVQTVGLMERCSGFASNDSGLMHLASALGVPTVGIFGPTDPVKNQTLGKNTVFLRLGLACSPCSREIAMSQCEHHDCLMKLGVDQGFGAMAKALGTVLGSAACSDSSAA